MPELSELFNNLLGQLTVSAKVRPTGPYGLAQTRVTRTPHIVAEDFGPSDLRGVFIRSDANDIIKHLRPDINAPLYPPDTGFIMTRSQDTNTPTIKHESMHSILDRAGLYKGNQAIVDSVYPRMDNVLKDFLYDNYDLMIRLSPDRMVDEGLSFAVEEPEVRPGMLEALFNTLQQQGRKKELEQVKRLVGKENKFKKALGVMFR